MDSDQPICSWDTTPITLRGWLRSLPKYLRKKDPRFRTLWESGFVMSKEYTYAPTRTHARALKESDVVQHTFDKPIPWVIFDEGSDDDQDDEACRQECGRYITWSSQLLSEVDRLCAEAITDTITITSAADDWLERSQSSCLLLIPMLHAELKKIGDSANSLLRNKMTALVHVGPQAACIAAFSGWREQFDLLNTSCSIQLDDSQVAQSYMDAMTPLGPAIEDKVLLELRLGNARGNSKGTVRCITAVLAEHEVSEARKQSSAAGLTSAGAALLLARDPARRTIANVSPGGGLNPSGLDKDKPPPSECETCRKELNECHMHWHSKCPRRAANRDKALAAKRDKDKKGSSRKAKAALAASTLQSKIDAGVAAELEKRSAAAPAIANDATGAAAVATSSNGRLELELDLFAGEPGTPHTVSIPTSAAAACAVRGDSNAGRSATKGVGEGALSRGGHSRNFVPDTTHIGDQCACALMGSATGPATCQNLVE